LADGSARNCEAIVTGVAQFRINDAAELLGVSADTVRRWADSGRLVAHRDEHGHRLVEGADLADYVRREGQEATAGQLGLSSARNRFRGLVTAVLKDSVMAQVEIQAGPHRLVSLMSREAVDELGLAVGSVAYAVIKSTNVIVELPRG
jgi:molybdopterin-binding protein